MTTLREGRVSWTFGDGWTATKYDDWSFYRNQFTGLAGGSKAVDILALDPDIEVLWMVEAKDFTTEPRDRSKPELWLEVAQKVRDTLAGIVAAACVTCDEQALARSLLGAKKLRVVLHLEQPSKPSKLFPQSYDPADILDKLRVAVRAVDAHPRVVDTKSKGLPWTAEWTPNT